MKRDRAAEAADTTAAEASAFWDFVKLRYPRSDSVKEHRIQKYAELAFPDVNLRTFSKPFFSQIARG